MFADEEAHQLNPDSWKGHQLMDPSFPPSKIYKHLIDSFRLKVTEREYDYTDAGDDFRWFLDCAEEVGDYGPRGIGMDPRKKRAPILPGWWNKTHRAECKRLANDRKKGNWSCVYRPIDWDDVRGHYGMASAGMQLKSLAMIVFNWRMMPV